MTTSRVDLDAVVAGTGPHDRNDPQHLRPGVGCGSFVARRGISADFRFGRLAGIVGLNGAGQCTFSNTLSDQFAPGASLDHVEAPCRARMLGKTSG